MAYQLTQWGVISTRPLILLITQTRTERKYLEIEVTWLGEIQWHWIYDEKLLEKVLYYFRYDISFVIFYCEGFHNNNL